MIPRYITGAALAAALTIAPSVAWAGTSTTTAPAAPTTTIAPSTPKAATPATPATPAKARTYDIISGTYVRKGKADARVAAMTAKHITGMSVVPVGTKHVRYRVEDKGLTKTAARTLSKALRSAGFSNHIVVE